MVKATLICTVYNEADTIRELLDSMQSQTHRPAEVVIVDGGSDDGTWQILQERAADWEPLRVIQEDGCNIAEGRNIAVREASHDYIVGTDGGCILDDHWYEEMVWEFENGAEYVIGMFEALGDTMFETVQGHIICSAHTVKELQRGNRGPSSRSVGFSRQAWQDAGGYPEDLYTGEDAKFNTQVIAAGYEPAIAPEAVVYWRMRPTWSDLFDQFYTYGEGDAKGGNLFAHPSRKLGITKNAMILGYGLLTAFLAIAIPFTASNNPIFTYNIATLAFFLLIPTLYYGRPVAKLAADDITTLPTAIGITQIKTWAWVLGFIITCLTHPSLIPLQVTSWYERYHAD